VPSFLLTEFPHLATNPVPDQNYIIEDKKPMKEKKAKDFIQSCGEAWQCILCKKVLSNRVKAVLHIEDLHPASLVVGQNYPNI